MMMYSIQPITASKAESAAEELEGEKRETEHDEVYEPQNKGKHSSCPPKANYML